MRCLDETKYGTMNEDGIYDGLIGHVQSNRVSTVIGNFPFDSLPNEPGIQVQSPMPSFTPHVYAKKIRGEYKTGIDILYLFTNFKPHHWLYWLISLTICSVVYVMLEHFPAFEFKRRTMLQRFIRSYYDYFMLAIDMSPATVSHLTSVTILWTAIVIAVYYGIHMIFMSTLSADLAARGTDKWIARFDDLLNDPTFRNFTPTITNMCNMVGVLSRSRDGTEARKLYNKIISNGSVLNFGSLDMEGRGSMMTGLMNDLAHGNRSYIEDSTMIDLLMETMLCPYMPNQVKVLVKSEESLYNSPSVTLISHGTHPDIVKLYVYRSQNVVEFGMIPGAIPINIADAMEEFGIKKNAEAFRCIDAVNRITKPDISNEWNPLPYAFFKRLFFDVCLVIMVIGLLCLIIEIAIFRRITSRKSIKINIVTIRKPNAVSSAKIVRNKQTIRHTSHSRSLSK